MLLILGEAVLSTGWIYEVGIKHGGNYSHLQYTSRVET